MTINLSLGDSQELITRAKAEGLTVPQIAYILATAYWETNKTVKPVEEAYYLGSKAASYRKGLRYYPYYGRGYVQLTWEYNYKKSSTKLGVDLVTKPTLALNKEYAVPITIYGMKEGWFTGKKLSDYISSSKKDYVNARRIINGTDKAKEIAEIAEQYEKLLSSSASTFQKIASWLKGLLNG